jgi:hypothetical protein
MNMTTKKTLGFLAFHLWAKAKVLERRPLKHLPGRNQKHLIQDLDIKRQNQHPRSLKRNVLMIVMQRKQVFVLPAKKKRRTRFSDARWVAPNPKVTGKSPL